LTKGNSYSFDLFYAERHTTSSDLTFTTSLLIQCPWYDWCGVCQGNGQTCCTCNDNNPCTTDTCDVNTGMCKVNLHTNLPRCLHLYQFDMYPTC
jgi:hypothetical protein